MTSWNNKQAPGLRGRRHRPAVLLDLPLAAARQQPQLLPPARQPQDDAGRPDQRDGDRRHPGPARAWRCCPTRCRSSARRATRRWPRRSPSCARGWPAARTASTAPTPGASGNYDQSRRDPDHGRLVAAAGPGRVRPVLGTDLLDQVESEFPINDEPGHGTQRPHLGSLAGTSASTGSSRRTCARPCAAGRGAAQPRLLRRRLAAAPAGAALESSLRQAVARDPDQVYPADGVCAAGDQMCSDSIQFRAIGGDHPAADRVGQPADLPAGRRDPGPRPGIARGRRAASARRLQAAVSILMRPRQPCGVVSRRHPAGFSR